MGRMDGEFLIGVTERLGLKMEIIGRHIRPKTVCLWSGTWHIHVRHNLLHDTSGSMGFCNKRRSWIECLAVNVQNENYKSYWDSQDWMSGRAAPCNGSNNLVLDFVIMEIKWWGKFYMVSTDIWPLWQVEASKFSLQISYFLQNCKKGKPLKKVFNPI